jgi:hypothetical protein
VIRSGLSGAILALALPVSAAGEMVDFVVTEGKLAQGDFYRLVACAAPPGTPCRDEIVRWPPDQAMALGVALAPVSRDYPARMAAAMSRALDDAILAINRVGAGVRLHRLPRGAEAPVVIHLVPVATGERIRGTGNRWVDGTTIGAGLVTVWWNEELELTDALIALVADLPLGEVYPVMLEELTQSLGLLTDIRNPDYEKNSVFSEDSNAVTRLGLQDRIALRMHYPPPRKPLRKPLQNKVTR